MYQYENDTEYGILRVDYLLTADYHDYSNSGIRDEHNYKIMSGLKNYKNSESACFGDRYKTIILLVTIAISLNYM